MRRIEIVEGLLLNTDRLFKLFYILSAPLSESSLSLSVALFALLGGGIYLVLYVSINFFFLEFIKGESKPGLAQHPWTDFKNSNNSDLIGACAQAPEELGITTPIQTR